MTCKLRTLGLSMIAALAIGSVTASAAQAESPEFHVETAPATITGSLKFGEHFFNTSLGKAKCTSASFSGPQTAKTTTTMTLIPAYEGCTFIGLSAKIETNGCSYVFHLVKGSSPATALMDIACPKEKDITIVAGECVVHIEPQTGLSHVLFENTFPEEVLPSDVDATITVTGMSYILTPGCPGIEEEVTFGSGEYKESVTLTADNNNGKGEALWVK